MQSQQRSLVETSRILSLAPQNILLVDSARELVSFHTACYPPEYSNTQPMAAMAARNMPSRRRNRTGTRIRCCRRLESSSLFTGGRGVPSFRSWVSAESDQGQNEPGEHGATQDATKGIHPTQHLIARPQREGRRCEDDQNVAYPALGVA